jgi:Ribbon-helix-helix protein, copG family
MPAAGTGTVRRNLVLPKELLRKLSEMAERHGTSTADLMKSALKAGLVVLEALQTPGTEVLIRDSRGEQTVKIVV